jgi:ABC-type tungstate transport system permease subunit
MAASPRARLGGSTDSSANRQPSGKDKGSWYWEGHDGMGSALDAYVLLDGVTWSTLKNNLGDLVIEVEGDKRLFNQYGVILATPAKYPSVSGRPLGERDDLGQVFGGPGWPSTS